MHLPEFHEIKMENPIEIFSHPGDQLDDKPEEQICASITNTTNNYINTPEQSSQPSNSAGASSLGGDQVCASTSDSTNVQRSNQEKSIRKINQDLLMSVIDDLTSKQQKFQGSESALLSRITYLENELKDSHLKHVICAKKLAIAQQELEEAHIKNKQKDLALIELRDECNALNTSVHRSNEAVELAFLECGELHNTQAQSNKERDDACQEMQRIRNDYNEKISKMKSTMDSYKQKMKDVIKSMRQQANSLEQLDFDEI